MYKGFGDKEKSLVLEATEWPKENEKNREQRGGGGPPRENLKRSPNISLARASKLFSAALLMSNFKKALMMNFHYISQNLLCSTNTMYYLYCNQIKRVLGFDM